MHMVVEREPPLQGLSAAVFTDYFHMIFNLMMIKNGTSNKRSENGIQNLTSSNNGQMPPIQRSALGGYRLDVDWQI